MATAELVVLWVGVGISLFAAGGALIVSLVALKKQGEEVAEARRSASAAEESAKEARRSADAAEESARTEAEALAFAKDAASRADIRWLLQPAGPNSYALTNDGGSPAYDVSLVTGYDIRGQRVNFGEIEPGTGKRFLISPTQGHRAQGLTVHYYETPDRSGPAKTWTCDYT